VSSDESPTIGELERDRGAVSRPLLRLFLEYGEGSRRWFALGVGSSMLARFLSLVPPIVLGVAIDALFRGDRAYDLPFVPDAWLPDGTLDQFWFSVGVMGVALVGAAVANFLRQSSLNLFSHRVKHEVRTATSNGRPGSSSRRPASAWPASHPTGPARTNGCPARA